MNLPNGLPDYFWDPTNIFELDVYNYPYNETGSTIQNGTFSILMLQLQFYSNFETDLKDKSDTAKDMTTALNDVQLQAEEVRSNISGIFNCCVLKHLKLTFQDIENKLNGFENLLTQRTVVENLADQLRATLQIGEKSLNWVCVCTCNVICCCLFVEWQALEEGLSLLNGVDTFITASVNELINLTQCYFVGQTFGNLNSQLCNVFS
jgi:hypothetical protein